MAKPGVPPTPYGGGKPTPKPGVTPTPYGGGSPTPKPGVTPTPYGGTGAPEPFRPPTATPVTSIPAAEISPAPFFETTNGLFPSSPAPWQPPAPMAGDLNLQWGGPAEGYWAQTQSQYTSPSYSENVMGHIGNSLSTPGQGETTAYGAVPGMMAPGAAENYWGQGQGNVDRGQGAGNMATQVFQDYQATAGADPGLGAYYDNAGRQALEKINQNAAARGVYGSSAAIDSGSEALTNLAADRAKNEADYNLRRLDTGASIAQGAEESQRGWFDSGADAAFKADESSLARDIAGVRTALDADRSGRERLELMGGVASDADRAKMDRLRAGQSGSSTAQTQRQARIGQLFDSIFGAGKSVSGDAGAAFENMTQDQLDLLTQYLTATLGGPSTALNYDTYEANQHSQEYKDWMEMWFPKMGGGGGGGGLPSGGP